MPGYYALKQTHVNPTANVFFDTAPENSGKLVEFIDNSRQIYMKNGSDWYLSSTTFGRDGDSYVRVTTIPGFDTVEAAESQFNDFQNSKFWQENIFPWNRDNGVRGMFEVVDADGNRVKLLHDNRAIPAFDGDGPTAWAPYIPE